MTQPFDEQLTRAFDSLTERLHAQIADQLLVTTRQIAGAVESERRAVAEAAARDAAALAERQVAERLRQEFAAREEQLKEAARAEWFETGAQHARAEAKAAADAAAAALDEHRAQLAALRVAADAQAATLAAVHDEHARVEQEMRADHEQAVDALRAGHDATLASVRAEHDAAIASLRAEYDAALAEARAELDAARLHVQAAHADAQAALAAAAARAGVGAVPLPTGSSSANQTRVLHAVRSLDAATSLSQTLDALFAAARAEARRVAMFLVRGDVLRSWNHAGFEALPAGTTIDLSLADAGLVADAVRTAASRRLASTAAARPAFAASSPGGPLIAVPLAMNGQVIAVLCAEEDAGSGDGLTQIFEVLARHAARVLESLTALRLAQAVPSAGAGSPSR